MMLAFGGSLFAQCPFKYGATEEDSLKGLEQVSLFNMSYKAKNYAEAYEAWQYIVKHCPCAWDGVYTNAQNMLQNLIKDEKDSLRREHLIDTLIYSYEVRSNYFPEKFTKGYGLGFKAYNTLIYRGKNCTSDELMQVLDWFIQSVEMEKEKTQPAIWDKYFQLAEIVTKSKRDTSYVIEAYGRATDYLDVSTNNALVKYEKQSEALEALNAQLVQSLLAHRRIQVTHSTRVKLYCTRAMALHRVGIHVGIDIGLHHTDGKLLPQRILVDVGNVSPPSTRW